MTCPANNAGFSALLAHSGAHYNSHKNRAQTVMRLSRYGLRCSAAAYGGKVKTYSSRGNGCVLENSLGDIRTMSVL